MHKKIKLSTTPLTSLSPSKHSFTAVIFADVIILWISAPVKFCVRSAKYAKSTSSARCNVLASVRKMANRAGRSGNGHSTNRSMRPDRNSAPSSSSGRDVAAITMTPWRPSTPSSSVSNWLTTRSVTPVESWPRLYIIKCIVLFLVFFFNCNSHPNSLWCQTIKLVEEQHTRPSALGPNKQVAHVLLALPNVLGQQLGSLHRNQA